MKSNLWNKEVLGNIVVRKNMALSQVDFGILKRGWGLYLKRGGCKGGRVDYHRWALMEKLAWGREIMGGLVKERWYKYKFLSWNDMQTKRKKEKKKELISRSQN